MEAGLQDILGSKIMIMVVPLGQVDLLELSPKNDRKTEPP